MLVVEPESGSKSLSFFNQYNLFKVILESGITPITISNGFPIFISSVKIKIPRADRANKLFWWKSMYPLPGWVWLIPE